MPPLDLTKEPSPKTVARALEDYGARPHDPLHYVFAKRIVDGMTAQKAFLSCWPSYSENAASVQACRLLAHPKMRHDIIPAQMAGARQIVQAYMPRAIEQTIDIAENGTKDDKVRLDALSSAMDRGGLPRSNEIQVSAVTVAWEAVATIPGALGGTDDPQSPSPSTTSDPLEHRRADWQRLLPKPPSS